MPSCAVVGVLPPSIEFMNHVKSTLTSIDGKDIVWRDDYSLVEDEERGDALTLLMTAIYDEPITHESVVAAVSSELKKQRQEQPDTSVETSEQEQSLCELWASAPAPLPLCPLEGYNKIVNVPANFWFRD